MQFPCPPSFDADVWEVEELPRRGTLWSFTIQRFRLKSPPYAGPEDFTPYAVGYIELPGAIIIESRLIDTPFDQLRIGMAMTLVIEPIEILGAMRIGFAFTAAGDAA